MFTVTDTKVTEKPEKRFIVMTVQKVGKIITAVGIILTYGAFGAADYESISLTRFLIALVCRLAITLFGIYLSCYEEPNEYTDEIEVD